MVKHMNMLVPLISVCHGADDNLDTPHRVRHRSIVGSMSDEYVVQTNIGSSHPHSTYTTQDPRKQLREIPKKHKSTRRSMDTTP